MNASIRIVPMASKKLLPGREEASDVRCERDAAELMAHVECPAVEGWYRSDDPVVTTLFPAVLSVYL